MSRAAQPERFLDAQSLGPSSQKLLNALTDKLIEQPDAALALLHAYQTFQAGMHPRGRPISTLLFLGPTGVGKTRSVEVMAGALFNDEQAVLKIDCAEFQHDHETAKLVGSPPGYLGHKETNPMLTQEAVDKLQTDAVPMTLVLLDEIEKASPMFWKMLLGILDKGTLTLGDNTTVSFENTIIVMTSNLGSDEIQKALGNTAMGFSGGRKVEIPKLDSITDAAVKRSFAPEFINRIDRRVVFPPLSDAALRRILDLELTQVQLRLFLSRKAPAALLQYTDAAKDYLLEMGTDAKYGARHLKRTIETQIVQPLSNIIVTNQIGQGDCILVDWNGQGVSFQQSEPPDGATIEDLAPDLAKLFKAYSSEESDDDSRAEVASAGGWEPVPNS